MVGDESASTRRYVELSFDEIVRFGGEQAAIVAGIEADDEWALISWI